MAEPILDDIRRAIADGAGITALTGAGISAESGVKTFRDSGGLWENHSIEEVATPRGFARNPDLVQRFYDERRRGLRTVVPNAAHRALALLEERLGDRFTLITQHVDDLHESAGARRVIHMHGELRKARCIDCAEVVPWDADISPESRCAACGGRLRPHIVWFGEMPFHMDEEIPRALRARIFVAIGTSGVVYPAAGFVAEARARGSITVEINLERSANASLFDIAIIGKATEKVPEFVRAILGDT